MCRTQTALSMFRIEGKIIYTSCHPRDGAMNGIGLGVIVSDQQGRFRVLLHIQIVSGVDGRGLSSPHPVTVSMRNDYD